MEVAAMEAPIACVYKTADGAPLLVDVYPAAGPDAPAPTLVFWHGGCLMYGTRQGIRPTHLAHYRRAGYAVVCVDYRLAPETKLPGIIADLRDAFAWVGGEGAARFGFDPTRLAAVGHSAGGYLTLMAGDCATPRPRALVSFYGYGDIVGDWYRLPDPFYRQQPLVSADEARSERGKLYLYYRQNGLWPQEVGGRDPQSDPDFFRPYCPVHAVRADYPPTLLLHGDRDTDVPHHQSAQMADALARAGVAHTFISLPGYGHGFDAQEDDPRVQDAFRQVLDFLARWIGAPSAV